MYKPIVIATGVIIALGATSEGAATAAKLTDSQIAHIVVTADNLDIANAKQALQKSKNAEVQRFAHRMIADHGSVTDRLSRWQRSSRSLLRIILGARA
jgi:putative membrane protein